MHLLEGESLARVRPLFAVPHLRLVMESVIAGHTPARVWADDPRAPRAAFAWDGAHCHYLAGEPHPEFRENLAALLRDSVGPEARAKGHAFFKASATETAWEDFLPGLFAPVVLTRYERCFYTLDAPRINNWREIIPEGFTVRPIDANLLHTDRPHREDVLNEVCQMWGTAEEFLAHGFGRCALHGETIVSWCTAEYVSPGMCGIGVETIEPYQCRNFGTLVSAAFIEDSLARGLQPHWDAWCANVPSVRLAEKVGFADPITYAAYTGSWDGV